MAEKAFSEIYEAVIRNNRIREQRTLALGIATLSKHATRRDEGSTSLRKDIRNPFAHDTDRIIHCNAFARYMDKTQVFFQIKNDHIARRSLHIQMVSRIARTLGRFLRLNEDLIEAIAVGHDVGHTPFGHAGESVLAEILEERGCGSFVHNAQSVRVLQNMEWHGKGLNLTLQVLDGILGHNGEVELNEIKFDKRNLTWENLDSNLRSCFERPRSEQIDKHIFPSTMEGCVVRVADMISYLGKDFEDAITLKLIKREDLPLTIAQTLGSSNKDIINNLCLDILHNSYKKAYVAFSDEKYRAMVEMKKFNYDRIYNCELIRVQREKFSKMVRQLFECYLDDIKKNHTSSDIFNDFIVHHTGKYWEEETPERMVADYIAGMTDQYFLKQYSLRFIPQLIDYCDIEIIGKPQIKYGI